jgi:MFS family permease
LQLSQAINLSVIPGLCGVLLVAFVLRERRRDDAPAAKEMVIQSPGAQANTAAEPKPPLPAALRRYLLLVGVFSFARASETFIVLRGHELGMDTVTLLLLWAMLSFAKSVAAWLGGKWSDRLGRRLLVRVGWLAYAVGFGLMALVQDTQALWTAALLFGAMAGTAEGAERALVGDLAQTGGPGRQVGSGRAYGWYNFVLGVAAVPAGLAFGVLWQFQGAVAAFSGAALIAGACVVGLSATMKEPATAPN